MSTIYLMAGARSTQIINSNYMAAAKRLACRGWTNRRVVWTEQNNIEIRRDGETLVYLLDPNPLHYQPHL